MKGIGLVLTLVSVAYLLYKHYPTTPKTFATEVLADSKNGNMPRPAGGQSQVY